MIDVPGLRVVGSGETNIALVLPDHASEPNRNGEQEAVALRLAQDPATTAVVLPPDTDLQDRVRLIAKLTGDGAAIGLVIPNDYPWELYRTLNELNNRWPIDGMVGPTNLDFTGYFIPHPHAAFSNFEGQGPIEIGQRWSNAKRQREASARSTRDIEEVLNMPGELPTEYVKLQELLKGFKFRTRQHRAQIATLLRRYQLDYIYTDGLKQVRKYNSEDVQGLLARLIGTEKAGGLTELPRDVELAASVPGLGYRAAAPVVASNISEIRAGAAEQFAMLGGYGCLANAEEVIVLPPPKPPGALFVAAMVHPYTTQYARMIAVRRDIKREEIPSVFKQAANVRMANSSPRSIVVAGAGDMEQTTALLVNGTAERAQGPPSFVVLDAGLQGPDLAQALVGRGIPQDRISISPSAGRPGKRAANAARRRGFQVVPSREADNSIQGRRPDRGR